MALKKFKIDNAEQEKFLNIENAANYADVDFSTLKNLEELWINSKKDYQIPEQLAHLTKLKKLIVNDHCHLPKSIDQLTSLEVLYVGNEAIYNVPDSIKNCRTIKELHIGFYPKNSEAMVSPEWIFKVNSVERLSITVCKFSEIIIDADPENQLLEVDLSCSLSDLKIFPDLSTLTKVKKLNLSAETFVGQKLPNYELFGQMLESVKDLSQIEELDISYWRPKKKSERLVIQDGKVSIPDVFDSLPHLFRLSIADMKIDFVPDSILRLKKLRELQVQGNNFSKEELARIKTSLSSCGIRNY